MKKKYKSSRKYHCPYCNALMTRDKLVAHVDKEHEIMIPEGYSAARVVYDSINGKNYGTCMVCKKKVYEWDERICRYKNLCDDPRCLAHVQNKARDNHLDDPEVQKKMLAGRRITGTYEFQDGIAHSYTGSYEKEAWKFMDRVMNIPGKDLMIPGPVIDYEYNGETHKWILDALYIPAMLAIDVKDGGSNPNTRPMESYREKQIAKEEAIAKQGVYNYLRLTDNNFSQLMEALADIRAGIMENDPKKGIYINEGVGMGSTTAGVMVGMASSNYIIPYGFKGMNDSDIEGFAFGNTAMDDIFRYKLNDDGSEEIVKENKNEFLKDRAHQIIYAKHARGNLKPKATFNAMMEVFLGHKYTSINDFSFSENLIIAPNRPMFREACFAKMVYRQYMQETGEIIQENLVKTIGNIKIMQNLDGSYYMVAPDDCPLQSPDFESLDDIKDDTIQFMNDLYLKARKEKEDHAI